MIEEKERRIGRFLPMIAIVVSLFALYVNWQTFIVNNRPYIKISPIRLNESSRYYSLDKINQNEYILNFKFKVENLGKIPANNINIKGEFFAFLKSLPANKMKNKVVKKELEGLIDAQHMPYDRQMSVEAYNDSEVKKMMDEALNKDFDIKKMPRSWKNISLLPGESFEYVQRSRIYGKDAEWVVNNFNKEKAFRIKVEVSYRGILPKVGRSYYSYVFFVYENGEMFPFESKNL